MKKVKELVPYCASLLVIISSIAYFNYLQWQSAFLNLVDARNALGNVIALEEVLLFWDKKDEVSEDWISGYEKKIEKNRQALEEMWKDFKHLERLSLFSKLTFWKGRADLFRVIKTNLSLSHMEVVASVAIRGKER